MANSELMIFGHVLHKGHKLTDRARAMGAIAPDTQRISFGLVYTIPVFSLSPVVIQTTEGRKNLDSIKWMLPRFFRFALNDKSEHSNNISH
jgi:hypothetical protein